MLPTISKGRTPSNVRPNPVFPHYLRRIIKWRQMDIEYTFWQMLHLCTSPKVVYQHTKYHKQTKNQWARDDPAFVVICILLLAFSTLAYCAAYDCSTAHAVFVIISVLLFHFLLTGVVLAACCWFLTNNYLREEAPNSHAVEQRVEWLYAFDIHCNSFFPMFIILYVIHYFLSPLLVAHGFIPVLLSNLLFMVAVSYYHYLNFLGYDVLPFLERTTFFLYPIGIVIVLSPIMILSGFNPSRYIMNMYFSQRL
ncbi:Protein unc-50 like [Actinidia chinensis var. chinensis]|uniref:Protein unc-50 like n=1 Tax=Actinidia chinensis var. chinensis TaxID=1590841 RepID=A0A2R6R1U8_ACTCC|nr:Protein unc-50 like [Actinidia chinensis var. chinensis]